MSKYEKGLKFECNPYSFSKSGKGPVGSNKPASEKSNPNSYSLSNKKGK